MASGGAGTTRRAPKTAGAAASDAVEVYGYLDYRAFLRDVYRVKKRRGFSFRAFSRKAGLGSPNYLKLVIDGDRNLTAEMAERFALALGLAADAARFFVALVAFNQARGTVERDEAYAKLTGFRRYRTVRRIDEATIRYFARWYYPAIRELAARHDFREDPAWIGAMLWPAVGESEVTDALATLIELGLLARGEDGRLRHAEALVSTGAELRSMALARYHRAMMARAADSIDRVPPDQRDISSLTLCLGPDGLRRLKERIVRLRRELLELSELEQDPRQVVQVNFQLFPLSREEPAPAPIVSPSAAGGPHVHGAPAARRARR
ncbi:MAG: TIGR02147 family protein [Deltaproteobacteria bacterium]|nr:TIGR02147 family protein [Deltaproteobacteria bacterium]